MRLRSSTGNRCAALTLMALAGWGAAIAQADPPGGKIQFSEPSNPTIASNLNRLDPHKSTYKQVQEDLFKPFKLGNQYYNRDSMMGVPLPQPMVPVAPDKHMQESLEKRKNWAFANWNDLFPDPSMSDQSNEEAEGKVKKPVSLIERYYDSLNQKQSTATNRLNITGRFTEDFAGTNALDTSGESFTPEGQFNKIMKQVFNPGGANGADRNVVDFDHGSIRPLTPEQVQDEKKRFEEFQKLLDPHWVATPAADPLSAAFPTPTPGNNSTNLFNAAAQHRSPVIPSMAVADPTAKAFYSHAYDDPTALALGQTNNLLTPKPTPPLLPAASLQPFDNLPRRKF